MVKTIDDYLDEFEEMLSVWDERHKNKYTKQIKQALTELVDSVPDTEIACINVHKDACDAYNDHVQEVRNWKAKVKKEK